MPQRMWAILTIALGLTLAVLDGGIANVALPTIARDVHTSPANSIWVVNAYQLAVTISLLPLSSLGEIYGYRRIYQAGLVLFTLASLACALSSSLPTLIVARMLQGFGAAGIMSVNSALIRFIYPRRWLGRGVGLNATVGSIASALGPIGRRRYPVGRTWPWLFAVNVPLGVLGAVDRLADAAADAHCPASSSTSAARRCRRSPSDAAVRRVGDWATASSWVHVGVELVVAVGLRLRAGGAAVEPHRAAAAGRPAAHPAVRAVGRRPRSAPSSPSRSRRCRCRSCSSTGSSFDQVMTGLLMTPWPLVVAVIAPFSGRLADQYPAGLLGGCGLAVMALGLLAMALLPDHPTTFDIVWRMTMCGIGFGFFNTPNNRAIITSAPPIRTGGASGMQATARLLGQTMGAALVALVFTAFPVERHDGDAVHRGGGGRGGGVRQFQPAGGGVKSFLFPRHKDCLYPAR